MRHQDLLPAYRLAPIRARAGRRDVPYKVGNGSDPDEAPRILDAYVVAGGNFIDTADRYQLGGAEMLGRFLQGSSGLGVAPLVLMSST